MSLIGLKLTFAVMEKVRLIGERLKTVKNLQKSYLDERRRELEFYVSDWFYLKISPMKGVIHFGKKVKLNPILDVKAY